MVPPPDSLADVLGLAGFAAAVALLIMAVIAVVLSYFVALRSPPTQRAAWLAGISYAAVAILFLFGFLRGYELISTLAAVPAALLVFFGWRAVFRRAWVDGDEQPSEADALEDDDWKIGLLRLGIAVTLVVGFAALKMLLS
jgi:hypothetical protein